MTNLDPSSFNTTYHRNRNIEGNDEVSSLQGRNMKEKSGFREDDRAWVRIPSRLLHTVWSQIVALTKATLSVLLPFNYRTLHCVFFMTTSVICGAIVWATSRSSRPVPYVDSLFLCISALAGAGLRTVELSTLRPFQQSVIFTLLVIGHRVLLSLSVPLTRWLLFDEKFRKFNKMLSRADTSKPLIQTSSSVKMRKGNKSPTEALTPDQDNADLNGEDKIQWIDDDDIKFSHLSRRKTQQYHQHRVFPMVGVGARLDLQNHPRDSPSRLPNTEDAGDEQPTMRTLVRKVWKYAAPQYLDSRNSRFHGLTPEERERLGGVEYLAIKFLTMLIIVYWLTCLFFGILAVGCWIKAYHPGLAASNNGVSPFWMGAFLAVSAFVNNGMSLLDNSMVPFRESTYLLLVLGLLILAGNTLYPCLLRFIIWSIRKMLPARPSWAKWVITLDFILDHPRRLYTHIFPSRHSWYLLATVIVLNGIQWISFETLSLRNKEVQRIPLRFRILDGLFQSVSNRFGGFHLVSIGGLSQGLLILYGLMMLIPPHPVLITMRNTDVYEERSVAIYDEDDRPDFIPSIPYSFPSNCFTQRLVHTAPIQSPRVESSRTNWTRLQLSHQFGSDLMWIALGTFAISIAEHDHYTQDPVTFSTVNILFEVLSGYAGSGLSAGGPVGRQFSLCGSWHPISKVILGILIIKGRHHDLPRAIDRHVMLPSESLAWAEEEDAALRREDA